MEIIKNVNVLLTRQDNVQNRWFEDAQAIAAQRKIHLTAHWTLNSFKQQEQFNDSIKQENCDGIVILAVLAGPMHLIRKAVEHNKPVVLLNRTPSDMDEKVDWSWPILQREFPQTLVATMLPDAIETGREQARQIRALLPHGGRILSVLGDPGSSDSADRLKGFLEVIKGDISYSVATVAGNFSPDVAETACLRWLETMSKHAGFKVDAIASQSEAMIPGIRSAFRKAAAQFNLPHLIKSPISAIDGTPEYKIEVDRGTLAGLIETPSRVAAAINLLADYWEYGFKPSRPVELLPVSSYPPLNRIKPIRI
ncbi:MAG: sugar ABC transporter substrate-binding protein [Deltaproteobacteria bacterium]|nr:sugar ABC transporter substrate-binding protein [Deltaproteobacteria bacterium]